MSFQIIGKTKDLKSGADVIYVQSSINKYLEIVGSDFENFSIQRKREKHKAYQRLKADIRYILLDQGLHYLEKEKDTTGFSSQYGWVHAFAHGADLLTEVVCHPDFPNDKVHKVFN